MSPKKKTEDKEITRKPRKEDVFDFLHQHIIEGKYPPGKWLRQEDIASQLKVSMTPVREALDLLVSAGLAERVPYRGVRVFQLSNAEIVDAYAMRLLLETTAARVAAATITQEQVQALSEIVEQMKSMVTLKEMSKARQLSRTFHFSIVEAAGNPLMRRVYETIANTFPDWMLYEAMFRHPEALETTIRLEYKEHKAIVAALKAGNAELAAQRTAEHIISLGHELEEYIGIPAGILAKREQEIL